MGRRWTDKRVHDWTTCDCRQCRATADELLARWDSEQALRGIVNADERTPAEVVQDEIYYWQLQRDNRSKAN